MQQVQPSLSMQAMQSQHAWIISQHFGSPLVQVIMTPLSVMSHLHMPIVRLQQQTIMPFIIMQQLHMPPCSIEHRFWTMPHATLSSHEQVIFMPPCIFSILKVQRGTISQLELGIMPVAPIPGMLVPGIPIPGIPIPVRSIIIVLDMAKLLSWISPGQKPGILVAFPVDHVLKTRGSRGTSLG
jgi:hypothetical protein